MTAVAEPMPDAAELAEIGYAVAFAEIEAKRAKDKAASVRRHAEAAFMTARRHGYPQQEANLPDGTKLGLISIEKGAEITRTDEDELLLVIAANEPGGFEDYLLPVAYADDRVLALIAEHFPQFVDRRVKPEVDQRYRLEIAENNGRVLDHTSGERVQVATIERLQPTGKFSFRPAVNARQLVDDAIAAGEIDADGMPLVPIVAVAPRLPEVQVSDAPDARVPEGTAAIGNAPLEGEDSPACDGLYFDADGRFKSPEAAAMHACLVQGGFSTPAREARRMASANRHRNPEMVEMGLAWLDAHDLPLDGDSEPAP